MAPSWDVRCCSFHMVQQATETSLLVKYPAALALATCDLIGRIDRMRKDAIHLSRECMNVV